MPKVPEDKGCQRTKGANNAWVKSSEGPHRGRFSHELILDRACLLSKVHIVKHNNDYFIGNVNVGKHYSPVNENILSLKFEVCFHPS